MTSRLLGIVSVLALAAAPAWAQQPPPRPYRGLFGGGLGETDQLLTVNGSISSAYDHDLLADQGLDGGDRLNGSSGTYQQLDARLAYAVQRRRFNVDASLATSDRYVPVLSDSLITSHSGAIGASLQLSRRTRLTGSQTATYQPFYSLALFPALVEADAAAARTSNPDLGVARESYVTYNGDLNVTHVMSRRTSVEADYGYSRSDFRQVDRNFMSQLAGISMSRVLTRRLSLRLGYGLAQADYRTDADKFRVLNHTIDTGLGYARPLSRSSRITMSASSGLSVITWRGTTSYRVVGDARLNREIGRTWMASLAYNRSFGFVETFDEPFTQDALSFGVGGMINRRLQFRSTLGRSAGEIGLTTLGNRFATYYGTTGLTTGLTRYLGLGVDYSYFRYSFENGDFLPFAISPELNRQSVRAYLTVWVPLIHRQKVR